MKQPVNNVRLILFLCIKRHLASLDFKVTWKVLDVHKHTRCAWSIKFRNENPWNVLAVSSC